MSLLYIDGFDTYGNADGADAYPAMAEAGWIFSAGFTAEPNPQTFVDTRTGIGFSLTPANWTYGGTCARAFPTVGGVVIGFAIKLLTSAFMGLASIRYNNLVGSIFTQLSVMANGENGITVQSGSHIYASPPNVLFEDVWQYIEIKYSPGTGTSYLEIRVDGVAVISVTNEALLGNGAAAAVNMFYLEGGRSRADARGRPLYPEHDGHELQRLPRGLCRPLAGAGQRRRPEPDDAGERRHGQPLLERRRAAA